MVNRHKSWVMESVSDFVARKTTTIPHLSEHIVENLQLIQLMKPVLVKTTKTMQPNVLLLLRCSFSYSSSLKRLF